MRESLEGIGKVARHGPGSQDIARAMEPRHMGAPPTRHFTGRSTYPQFVDLENEWEEEALREMGEGEADGANPPEFEEFPEDGGAFSATLPDDHPHVREFLCFAAPEGREWDEERREAFAVLTPTARGGMAHRALLQLDEQAHRATMTEIWRMRELRAQENASQRAALAEEAVEEKETLARAGLDADADAEANPEASTDACSVCLLALEAGEASAQLVIHLECDHVFHRSCLFVWLRRSHCCPLCRRAAKARPPS